MPAGREIVVINTGPVVSLGRADLLDLVGSLPIDFIAPREVAEEVAAGAASGHPVGMPPWIAIESQTSPVMTLAAQALDRGEAAVIQLALDRRIRTVCIDEWRGRRAAHASGLTVTGSLGLLGRAKLEGLVPSVRPLVTRLAAKGAFYHPDLLRRFFAAIGEG